MCLVLRLFVLPHAMSSHDDAWRWNSYRQCNAMSNAMWRKTRATTTTNEWLLVGFWSLIGDQNKSKNENRLERGRSKVERKTCRVRAKYQPTYTAIARCEMQGADAFEWMNESWWISCFGWMVVFCFDRMITISHSDGYNLVLTLWVSHLRVRE